MTKPTWLFLTSFRAAFTIALLLLSFHGVVAAHGDVHSRLERINQQIDLHPGKAELYIQRGKLYQEDNDWQSAATDFQQALDIDKELDIALYHIGVVHKLQQNVKVAEHYLSAYLQKRPNGVAGYIALAELYESGEDHVKAADFWDNAIKNDKKKPSPDTFTDRAYNLMQMMPFPLQRFEVAMQEAIDTHGPIVTFIKLLIDGRTLAGNYDHALTGFRHLPETLSSSPNWLVRKADIHYLANQRQPAKKVYQQTLEKISLLPPTRRNSKALLSVREKAIRMLAVL